MRPTRDLTYPNDAQEFESLKFQILVLSIWQVKNPPAMHLRMVLVVYTVPIKKNCDIVDYAITLVIKTVIINTRFLSGIQKCG
jgi:hypothetical protein